MECALYLTDSCNFSCSYCYESDRKNHGVMNKKIAKQSIDYIFSVVQPKDPIIITFLGGEPLLNKNILYYSVDYINSEYSKFKKNITYKITTNASLITMEDIELFKKNNFILSISIDGDEKTHNRNRISNNGHNYYNKIIKYIKLMITKNIDCIVRMTVTGNNVFDLYNNVKYFYNLGVKKINVGIDNFHIWNFLELEVLKNQLKKMSEYYLVEIFPTDDKNFYLFDNKIGIFLEKRKNLYCNAGTEAHFSINSYGNIYPCSFVSNMEEWNIGNVNEGIDKNKFIYSLRNSIQLDNDKNIYLNKCKNCKVKYFCNTKKCGFGNYVNTKNMNIPSQSACKIQEILYEVIYSIVANLWNTKNYKFQEKIKMGGKMGISFSEDTKKILGGEI